jgi:hypothetical protein
MKLLQLKDMEDVMKVTLFHLAEDYYVCLAHSESQVQVFLTNVHKAAKSKTALPDCTINLPSKYNMQILNAVFKDDTDVYVTIGTAYEVQEHRVILLNAAGIIENKQVNLEMKSKGKGENKNGNIT